MIEVAPSTTFETSMDWGVTGLTGTLRYRLVDGAGGTSIAATTTGVTEFPASSGIYEVAPTSPATAGQYRIVWDDQSGTFANGDDLLVTSEPSSGTISSGHLYVTVSALKATLNMADYDFADDDFTLAVTAASRAIDSECGRRFYLDADNTSVRYYSPESFALLTVDDLADVAEVAVDVGGTGAFVAWATTAYNAGPYNALSDDRPYTFLETARGYSFPRVPRSVRVTGQFGWPSIPASISEATAIYASRLLKRAREAPFGIQSVGIDGIAARLSRTDPDLMMLLSSYVRRTMAL
jgi:hypothetical protein